MMDYVCRKDASLLVIRVLLLLLLLLLLQVSSTHGWMSGTPTTGSSLVRLPSFFSFGKHSQRCQYSSSLLLSSSSSSSSSDWTTSSSSSTTTGTENENDDTVDDNQSEIVTSTTTTTTTTTSQSTTTTGAVPKKFVPFPFQYHEEIIVRVDSLSNLGMGICKTKLPTSQTNTKTKTRTTISSSSSSSLSSHQDDKDDPTQQQQQQPHQQPNDLWVIFVPNVIPGELVKIKIYRNHKTYSDADLVDVLEPSPDRIDIPKCHLSTICGGCQYQHMTIDAQRNWKTIQVQDVLQRIGGLNHISVLDTTTTKTKTTTSDTAGVVSVLPTMGTEHVWHYRTKLTPHYDAPKKVVLNNDDDDDDDDNNHDDETETESDTSITTTSSFSSLPSYEIGPIGFKEKSTRRLVDVPSCPIATEAINDKLVQVRTDIRQAARDGSIKKPKKGATLLLRHVKEGVVTDPNQYVTTTVQTIDFTFLAGNFFQNNPHVMSLMVQHVIQEATRSSPSSSSSSISNSNSNSNKNNNEMLYLLDTYCGSGLFCLTAAAHFHQCVGIEVNEKAVQEAQRNAQQNNITNCHFMAASAEAIFEPSYNNMVKKKEQMKKKKKNNNKRRNDNIMDRTAVDIKDSLVGFETEADDDDDDDDDEDDIANNDDVSVVVVDVSLFDRSKTVVVCDPPRKGCSEEFLEQLFAYGPQRIVYMSCDVATQARDVKRILSHTTTIATTLPSSSLSDTNQTINKPMYAMTSIQPFDLFPQTRHIECCIVFEKQV